jgi:redox-sensitive bicupin YhaK (pirin superfamily)
MNNLAIDLVLPARSRTIGTFNVRRTLPAMQRRHVGPFVFFDHMGPVALPSGANADVLPHPHIGLATITYLFDGEIDHKDSIGSVQTIRPFDVNWMVAGHGIVHSERTPPEARARSHSLHGIQTWVALPMRQCADGDTD